MYGITLNIRSKKGCTVQGEGWAANRMTQVDRLEQWRHTGICCNTDSYLANSFGQSTRSYGRYRNSIPQRQSGNLSVSNITKCFSCTAEKILVLCRRNLLPSSVGKERRQEELCWINIGFSLHAWTERCRCFSRSGPTDDVHSYGQNCGNTLYKCA